MDDAAPPPGHFDVLIVGAGISGIGGAHHLREQCPGHSFVVLEAQEGFGGTWRTHRYPGIRSDSDLYTFGYRFKPWVGPPIATAPEILTYMAEVIAGDGLDRHIRHGHRVRTASWDSATARWSIEATRGDGGRCPLHRRLPVDVPGLLPARARLHARLARLLNHMQATGARQVEVALRPEDAGMALGPWIDPEEFSSGHVARRQHLLPRRGDQPEWAHAHDHRAEKDAIPAIDLADSAFVWR